MVSWRWFDQMPRSLLRGILYSGSYWILAGLATLLMAVQVWCVVRKELRGQAALAARQPSAAARCRSIFTN